MSEGTKGEGRIPFRLRVGVTGHRTLDNEAVLAARVKDALRRIRAVVPAPEHTEVRFSVVSPLAEGADRLVARVALEDDDTTLEVPLPMERNRYRDTFCSDAARAEFDEMTAHRATVVHLPDPNDRHRAYEQVGRYVVDRCDVLVAVWDGERARGQGGTAEVVAYAEDEGVPTIRISTVGACEISDDLGPAPAPDRSRFREAARLLRDGARRFGEDTRLFFSGREPEQPAEGRRRGLDALRDAVAHLDEYNRATGGLGTLQDATQRRRNDFAADAETSFGSGQPAVDAHGAWITPYAARASLLARHYARRYEWLSAAVFVLAALAVVTVTVQVLFLPGHAWLGFVEAGWMVLLVVVVVIGRAGRLHGRFVSARFLAERFRSAPFLALVGLDRPRSEAGPARRFRAGSSEEWIRRAFAEVWIGRPAPGGVALPLDGLRRLLEETWISRQRDWHWKRSWELARTYVRYGGVILVLFAGTIVAALLHAFEVGASEHHDGVVPDLLVLGSIALPALGAALSGIRAQREFERHADRYRQMSAYLEEKRADLDQVTDAEGLRAVVGRTEELMLEETEDWFGVMWFHDFELHV